MQRTGLVLHEPAIAGCLWARRRSMRTLFMRKKTASAELPSVLGLKANAGIEKALVLRIRAFQRSTQANWKCADCSEHGSTCICLDFQTFLVCCRMNSQKMAAQTAFVQNTIQTGATPASCCWSERYHVLRG